jgi:hypothetical protein
LSAVALVPRLAPLSVPLPAPVQLRFSPAPLSVQRVVLSSVQRPRRKTAWHMTGMATPTESPALKAWLCFVLTTVRADEIYDNTGLAHGFMGMPVLLSGSALDKFALVRNC